MSGLGGRRWTGALGVGYVVIQVLSSALFVAAGTPPGFDDAKKYADYISAGSGLFLADAFLTGVATLILIAFVTGIRGVIRAQGEDWEWAAGLSYGAGLMVAAIVFTNAALEATSAMVSTTGTDRTTVLALWAATHMVFAFIFLPMALLFATVSYAARQAGVLPLWAAWLGFSCAILNVAAVLTIFGGTGSYGPVGPLSIILGFLPAALWFLGVSVALLKVAPATAHPGADL